jgi:glycosyltransferase involved in cell wall biosynthesis
MGAPAARAAELARYWADDGHDVSVLTGFPNHPTGVVPAEWRGRFRRMAYHERVGGVDVFRTWLWPLPNRKAHERMRNYASFCLSAAVRGLTIPRPDVIIATSPQLLVGLSGWYMAFAKRIPFVFEVRDLWPESLTAVGLGSEKSLLHRFLSATAKFLYRRSDHIVVVTPAFKGHLIQHYGIAEEKISVVENGVETGIFAPSTPAANGAVRRALGADGKFLVCYVGTLGMAHGLGTLLDAAEKLKSQNPAVMLLLVGEGAERERIQAIAQSRGLANVRFMGEQPREKIPSLISASDACLVLLKKAEIFKTVIPTKMLEFMSCARPVIVGVDGLAREMVESAGAGIVIEPENSVALVRAITELASDRELGKAFGEKGRNYVLRRFTRYQTAQSYIHILQTVITHPDNRPAAAA